MQSREANQAELSVKALCFTSMLPTVLDTAGVT